MLRQSFGKIITLVIAISLLTGGLAPANARCTAKCCVQVKEPVADLVADCCSDLKTVPCPRTLESSPEFKDYAPSAVGPNVSPATLIIAAASNINFILPQSRPFWAAMRSPQIRGPGVPIYLLTETFLI